MKLLMKLIEAEDENIVDKIIRNDPILSEDRNWKPYGGFFGNFSQIHNQQGNSIPALVGKPINSIDALLLKECKLRDIDPEGRSAWFRSSIEHNTYFPIRRSCNEYDY